MKNTTGDRRLLFTLRDTSELLVLLLFCLHSALTAENSKENLMTHHDMRLGRTSFAVPVISPKNVDYVVQFYPLNRIVVHFKCCEFKSLKRNSERYKNLIV